MNQPMMPYERMDRVDDASPDTGVFAEVTRGARRVLAPDRRASPPDDWEAVDERATIRNPMMTMVMLNPNAGETRDDTLESGFLRQ
ncbi:MAG: hypothetical protein IPF57_03985 [Gammaproteobacteria bacterium]|nr:hypothetical protein [Gammaproteobacteria bacterium]